ncbi:hypothetical protein NIES4103_17650 [Nostoc sp. NIES-4103]|nr:hypothetical protein NIES4103_17650 [Nostoc sp. NIES-4103]
MCSTQVKTAVLFSRFTHLELLRVGYGASAITHPTGVAWLNLNKTPNPF